MTDRKTKQKTTARTYDKEYLTEQRDILRSADLVDINKTIRPYMMTINGVCAHNFGKRLSAVNILAAICRELNAPYDAEDTMREENKMTLEFYFDKNQIEKLIPLDTNEETTSQFK